MSQEGGELIGMGSFGCVFNPSLKCKGDKESKKDVVSKVFFSKDGKKELNDEYKLTSIIKSIPGYEEWAEVWYKKCQPITYDELYKEEPEIEDCLEQHLDADKSFYFYGAVPIDFSKCSVSDLCSFDMKKHLDKGETKIGIVFNTDPSTKGGQHWISLYMDLDKHNNSYPGIYYFDSFGKTPPKEIKELIKKAQEQGKKYNCEPYYFYNDYSYQKRNSQC